MAIPPPMLMTGNLTSVTPGNTLTYNNKNQTKTNGSDTTYTYGGSDQRDRVKVNSTTFVYSSLGLSSQTDSSGTTYYTRCNCGQLIGDREPSGSEYYYLLDAQGSVVATTDSSGNIVDGYVYEPFGTLLESNVTHANPWQFQSGFYDSTTGLYKFGTRYYDPTLGRWTQQDPIAGSLFNANGQNRYVFTGDDPINQVDPSGEQSCFYFSNGALDTIGWTYVGLGTELGIIGAIGGAVQPELVVFAALLVAAGLIVAAEGAFIVWAADKFAPNGMTVCV